ncbi:hypothetical protein GCM10023149_44760 [Mucilaginibacter gynuensis]|uniref:Uncharacterized protein n=1 Tax=Mucilaginibacter gynuensis TaxID=1302236 RepID=A0ABP8H9E2_9SPHI
MRKLILSALLIAVFASCKKLSDVVPAKGVGTETPNNTDPVVTPEEEAALLASLKITPLNYKVQEQQIKASVTGSKLTLAFDEKIHLLIDKDRYNTSWYIYFNEDYSNTAFADFDFTTKLQWGDVSQNYKPFNLNQIDKTVSDTTIAGVAVVNVKFERELKFFKNYETTEAANAKLNALIGTREDMKFSTSYMPDSTKNSISTTKVVYVK